MGGAPIFARRSSAAASPEPEMLDDAALAIQAGAIGRDYGPFPQASILSQSGSSVASLTQRDPRPMSPLSDVAVDLLSPGLFSRQLTPEVGLFDFPRIPYHHDSAASSTAASLPSQLRAPGVDFSNPLGIPGLNGLTRSQVGLLSAAGGGKGAGLDSKFLWAKGNEELDDFLHAPDPDVDRLLDRSAWRRKSFYEFANAASLLLIVLVILGLFLAWPVLRYSVLGSWKTPENGGASNLGWGPGGINASGQVPMIPNLPTLVDEDTPMESRTRTGFDGETYNLVFSDEFNVDGRTFWPGDDPYWEAVDLHYWETQDYEWYDPDAIITRDGQLQITLSEEPIHGLNFRSGMLQSWNKFCFTGGYVEISMSSPGNSRSMGYWPGAWTMGNLGRGGYGASNYGVWPYSYSSCDVGTLPNQTFSNHTPTAARTTGSHDYGGELSWLPGQRLSACTCPGEDHPGPNVSVGRGAPEIDITEQQIDYRGTGSTSQSMQFAPMDPAYAWLNVTPHMTIFNDSITFQNLFTGAIYQESASVITLTDTTSYEGAGYTRYGFEYEPGPSGSITWAVNNTPSWRILASAIGPNAATGVGQRLISEEPMSINLNLAISKAFQTPQWNLLTFPATLRFDYIRVYQKGTPNLGCDPPDYPTSDYINRHMDVYTNPNLTIWPTTFPRNSLSEQGCATVA
ncbi:hypothetical protein JCM1840_003160 [Sporobolomyces johnsonii]